MVRLNFRRSFPAGNIRPVNEEFVQAVLGIVRKFEIKKSSKGNMFGTCRACHGLCNNPGRREQALLKV